MATNLDTTVRSTKAEVEADLTAAGWRSVNWAAAPDVWIDRDGNVARVVPVRPKRYEPFQSPIGYRGEGWDMEATLLEYCCRDVFGDVPAAVAAAADRARADLAARKAALGMV